MEGEVAGDPVMRASHAGMHGKRGAEDWTAPVCVTDFDSNARYSFTDIKAHEWRDCETVLRCKVKLLAELIQCATNCLVFTGAGISTAAGIDDYATKGRDQAVVANGRPVIADWKLARPTKAHRVLVAMYEAGFLKHWVQQNHDSLPQKAGYPQHALNEIHGSLHDPANPIVPYEGSLRDDLFSWLSDWQQKNDLCIALGTSLSGFNVDSVAEVAARRNELGDGHGLVIVNLQQTPYDELSTLRIFATIDAVMELLAEELDIVAQVRAMDHIYTPSLADGSLIEEDVFLVPFDDEGRYSDTARNRWDLRVGQRLRLTGGPYGGDVGTIVEKSLEGHYRIRVEDSINPILKMKRRPFSLWLGSWWVEQATKGYGICPGGGIPCVNTSAKADELEVAQATPLVQPSGPVAKPKLKSQPPPPPPRRVPKSS